MGHVTKSLVALLDAEAGGQGAGVTLSSDLCAKKPDRRLDFGFEYRGIPFVVRAEASNQGTDLEIRANLGTLPFSAEDAERRATALAILNAASDDLGGRFRLDNNQHVVMVDVYRLDVPLTPAVLLTRTAELVLKTKPYMELLSLVVPPPLRRDDVPTAAVS